MWNKIEIQDLVADTKYPIGDGDHGAIKPTDYLKEGIPYIRVADISWEGNLNRDNMIYISADVNNQNPKSHLFPGDLIIAKTGATIGKAAIIPDDMPIANTTSSVGKITFDKRKIDPQFVMFYMRTDEFKKQMWAVSIKSAQPGFNIINLKKFTIPVPPFDDQIKIVKVLGNADALIKQRKESIDLLDMFLKSTFLKMFGDPVRNEKKFTKGTIRDVVTEVKYGTSKSASLKGRYAYLRMNNITTKGYMNFSDLKYIDISDNERHKYIVKKGDLLFNRTNSKELVGKTGVFFRDDEMVIAGYLIRVRTNAKANSWYLWGYLNSSHGKNTLLGMSKAIVGMANINAQELQDIEILIPPIKLQNQFAAIVEKAETLKSQFQSSLNDLENLYASLSQLAFKGELDLSAIEINKTMLPENEKEGLIISMHPGIQKAIALSDKINKQFERINRTTKLPSALTKQLEQWNKLQNEFKHISKLPEALLQAQKNMARIKDAIGISKVGTTKIPVEEEPGFNWAVLANSIKERYKNRHFNFEMLHSFIQKDKLAKSTPYYTSEELKTNPRLNDAEDLKSFIQTAIQNIEMDEKQQRQTNPFLRLNQSFFNAEEENFTLSLHEEDFKLIKDKTTRQRSGIYFSLATEA